MWNVIIGGIIAKVVSIFEQWFILWNKKRARNNAIDAATKKLKNAKTPEDQESASAELIRVTTPND